MPARGRRACDYDFLASGVCPPSDELTLISQRARLRDAAAEILDLEVLAALPGACNHSQLRALVYGDLVEVTVVRLTEPECRVLRQGTDGDVRIADLRDDQALLQPGL
jgi:hypothetical protein